MYRIKKYFIRGNEHSLSQFERINQKEKWKNWEWQRVSTNTSLQDKFIFSQHNEDNNEKMDLCEESKEINININNSNNFTPEKDVDNIPDEVMKQRKLATIKIISDINKRYKRRKKNLFK